MGESITGPSDDFLGLQTKLAAQIAGTLRIVFKTETKAKKGGLPAAVYFSKGLQALDRNDKKEADQFFAKSIALDPAYQEQVNELLGEKP